MFFLFFKFCFNIVKVFVVSISFCVIGLKYIEEIGRGFIFMICLFNC